MPELFNITKPPAQLGKEERMLVRASTDLILFGKIFLAPDFGQSKTPPFHYEIADALMDDETTRQLALIVPRGHAKSVLIKTYILNKFLFNNYFNANNNPLFFGWVSDRLTKSYGNIRYLKDNIEWNTRINRYFGNMRGNRWTSQEIEMSNKCLLVSRSNATSIRGETLGTAEGGAQRYHRIILDDIESEDNTGTFEARQKIKEAVVSAVYPALDNYKGRLIMAATPVHYDSMCQNILDGHKKALSEGTVDTYSWHVISYKATQPSMEGGVLWSSFFPRAKLDQKRKFAEDSGNLASYYQEFELEPQSGTSRIWTTDHYTIHDAIYKWHAEKRTGLLDWKGQVFPVNCFLGSDPATDIATRGSDPSVILVVAYDAKMRIFVLEYVEKVSIPQMALRDDKDAIMEGSQMGVVDYIWTMYYQYHCQNAVIEDVGMTRGVWQDLESMKYKKKTWTMVAIPENPGGREKINKIVHGSNSLFVNHQVHVRKDQYTLREQIENIGPKMRHDDCVPPWSLIQTQNGLKPISEIQIGENVLTHSGKFKRVARIGSRMSDTVYKINSIGKAPVYVTDNHRIYVSFGILVNGQENSIAYCRMKYSVPEWLDVIDIQKKLSENPKLTAYSLFKFDSTTELPKDIDLLKYGEGRYVQDNDETLRAVTYNGNRTNAKYNKIKRWLPINDELLFIIGYYLAEGSCGSHSVHFASHLREENIRNKVNSFFTKLGCNPNIRNSRGNSVITSLGSVLFKRLFSEFGNGLNKKLSDQYLSIDSKLMMNVVIGWFLGDGTFKTGKKSIKCNTISRELANQMFNILVQNGFSPIVHKSERKEKGFGNDQWVITLSSIDAHKMKDMIPQSMWPDKRITKEQILSFHTSVKTNNGFLISKIKSIECIDYNDIVMNLEVEDDHSYVVENTIVHNCIESFWLATRHLIVPTMVYDGNKHKFVEDYVKKVINWKVR